jgi:hypothetical protein
LKAVFVAWRGLKMKSGLITRVRLTKKEQWKLSEGEQEMQRGMESE